MSDLECSNYPSYITIYKKPKMLFDKHNNNSFMYIDEYISVITARILHMTLKGIKTIPLYYFDNLCVHQDHRKNGIEFEMTATHCYNMSRLQSKVSTYLLCSSTIDMNAIVPLTTFITREYDISQFYFMSFPIGSVSLIEITKNNISLFTHFIHQYNKFNCIILPEISNIQHLLKTGNIYIYGIIQSRELISIYIFKKKTTISDTTNDNTINCIASLYIDGLSSDIFIIGFNQALHQIGKRDNTIKRIMIENTSHNATIIEYAKRINILIICEYPSAFFLYNYGCYSYQPSECLFIY